MGCSSHRHDNLHPLAWLLMLVVVLVTAWPVSAQSPSNNSNSSSSSSSSSGNNPYFANANFNPSMAIVIVVLISAFFFLGFFSIYIRQCAGDRRDTSITARSARAAAAAAGRSRRQRGLDPDILASFPTLAYSDVRAHKIGKGFLECAVCLSEFEDDETLRLLPMCDHVFHPDCIDAWLAAHVTCPVCRCNLDEPVDPAEVVAQPPPQEPEPASVQAPEEEHQVVIEMRPEESTEEERMRKAEIENLERFVNMKRARSRARPANFPRSHSTGHSLVLPGENLDRFTLRLPENIRRDLVRRAEMMKRTNSLVAFPTEGSSRRGYRGGEGSIGKGRSIRLGRSDRWGSFLLRTLSTKMPTWGRRGDGVDGSPSARGGGGGIFRRGDSMKGEGSARGVRFNAVVSPFDCYGGGAGAKEEDSQSSAAALNRV